MIGYCLEADCGDHRHGDGSFKCIYCDCLVGDSGQQVPLSDGSWVKRVFIRVF